jgi:hypothetical protein
MIRSLSLRSRCAAASKRASPEAPVARVERERLPLVGRVRPPAVERARALVVERVLPLAALLRVLRFAAPERLAPLELDFALELDPLLVVDLRDPLLLGCGMVLLLKTDSRTGGTLSR